jgi:hypothetical protein
LKSFIKPPKALNALGDCICLLFGQSASWENAKILISQNEFINELIKFNQDNLNHSLMTKLESYITNPILSIDNLKIVPASVIIFKWIRTLYELRKNNLKERNIRIIQLELKRY